MRVLIVEDDFTSRKLLQTFLRTYGDCDIAVDGQEAIEAFTMSWDEKKPYDLICMDIMLPKMDGHQALKQIRLFERERGVANADQVKVIMTSALGDPKNVVEAMYKEGAAAYLVKPLSKQELIGEIRKLRLVP
jgi:two-component system, chemotaxis family, chemotaxis protein CheY